MRSSPAYSGVHRARQRVPACPASPDVTYCRVSLAGPTAPANPRGGRGLAQWGRQYRPLATQASTQPTEETSDDKTHEPAFAPRGPAKRRRGRRPPGPSPQRLRPIQGHRSQRAAHPGIYRHGYAEPRPPREFSWVAGRSGRRRLRRRYDAAGERQKTVDERYAKAKRSTSKACAAFNDFREITGNKSIDAVVIATPDHWHVHPCVEAMKNGKDVYCEKPLTLTLAEGKLLIDVARKYDRVFQTGSQQRSSKEFRTACEAVRSGRIGKIKQVFADVGGPSRPCDLPEEPLEPGLDWNLWLGTAPTRPTIPCSAPAESTSTSRIGDPTASTRAGA